MTNDKDRGARAVGGVVAVALTRVSVGLSRFTATDFVQRPCDIPVPKDRIHRQVEMAIENEHIIM